MPLVDIVIALIIAGAAFLGYWKGLFGALKGIISSILGLIAARILGPIAHAWLESALGAETFLAEFVASRMPAALRDTIRMVAQASRTIQDVQENLMAQLPPEIGAYVNNSLGGAGTLSAPSADMLIESISRYIAQNMMSTFLFILICIIVTIVIRGLIGLITFDKDGKTIIGVFDGILGMVALTLIVVACLTVFSGFVHPLAFMSNPEGRFAEMYPHLLESKMIHWFGNFYHTHVNPMLNR